MKQLFRFLLFFGFFISFFSVSFAIENEPGASVRLRQEIWDNVVSLGTARDAQPDRNFFRLRIQLWDNVKFNDNLSAYARIATEPKYYDGPYELPLDNRTNFKNLDQDEVLIDNLYIDIKKPFDIPINFRIGRQDFLGKDMYGEGFLILDGTPGDGSRTFYFNALKATVLIAEGQSVDIVYVSDPKTDQYLPSLHPAYYDSGSADRTYIEHKKRLTASNERGFWVYGRNKIFEWLNIEPYYIYKKEEEYIGIDEKYINTFGIRTVFKVNDFTLRGEIARQIGKYDDGGKKIRGVGGYAFAGYSFKNSPLTPNVEVGYVYLSGDKTVSNDKDEGFNPLFSRAPQWNELLIYTLIPETSGKGGPIPGYWTNMKALVANLKIYPFKNADIKLSYQHLWADEQIQSSSINSTYQNMFSYNGKNRGDLWAVIGNYKFNKNLDGMLQIEYFEPGDFYKDAKNATFIRWQLQYKL
ncbi:alginate export family protein [Thermodesulfovibrio yellowstonii]|uniref:alginate export family protein n=1 Tax=Thermodesulfovibrio yellowstonii TaxID=28262 RepID=UPI00041AEBD3|nr:alginate export family protein [Thermodesulfovibrio islandicus]